MNFIDFCRTLRVYDWDTTSFLGGEVESSINQ